jgi:hypothetical protein
MQLAATPNLLRGEPRVTVNFLAETALAAGGGNNLIGEQPDLLARVTHCSDVRFRREAVHLIK